MNKQIKAWGEGLIKEWLCQEDSPGEKNLTKILSEPLLEELINYNDKGNFDRVMAFMMVVIYLQELHNVHVKDKKRTERNNRLFDIPIFSDAWFERNTSTSQPTLDNIPTYTF